MTAPYIPPRPRTLEEALRAAFMPPVQADATATPPVRPDFSGVPMATMRATSAPMPRGPRESGNPAADRLNARVDRGLAALGRMAAPSADTPEGWLREMLSPVRAGAGTREVANATMAQARRAGRTGNVTDVAMAAGLGGLTLASAIPGGPADDAARAGKMIDVDGVMRPRFNARGQAIHPTEDGIRNFWRWATEDGRVPYADNAGNPQRLLHGTTRDVEAFDPSLGNADNDWGRAIYTSNTASDIEANYAGVGPDLSNRIERTVERRIDEAFDELDEVPRYGTPEYDSVLERIREQVTQEMTDHGGATIPLYARTKKPAVVGGKDETFLAINIDDDGNESGPLVDLIMALRGNASVFDSGEEGIDSLVDDILSRGIDAGGISVRELHEIASNNSAFQSVEDHAGDIVSTELLRRSLEEIGFDAIHDRAVDVKFGSQRRLGKKMKGMTPETEHVIPFNALDVKSAIGNSGAFSRTDPRLTAGILAAFGIGNASRQQERP